MGMEEESKEKKKKKKCSVDLYCSKVFSNPPNLTWRWMCINSFGIIRIDPERFFLFSTNTYVVKSDMIFPVVFARVE